MADPSLAEPGNSFIKDRKAFLRKFHDVDDAIRHEKLEELLTRVEAGPVNLSDDPLLSVVIAYGKSNLAIELMQSMPSDNQDYLMAKNFNGDTALHVAVATGDKSVVDLLVEKNRNLLQATNNQRESPLHKAALFGRGQIFWKLVEHGSKVSARREDGATMLHCAVMGNAPGTVHLFFDAQYISSLCSSLVFNAEPCSF